MSQATSIEWTDRNWPFARGCQRVSPGYQNCYAERMAARFSKPGLWGHGFATMTSAGPRWTGKVEFLPGEMSAPLGVRKPQRFFPSTIDPFHEDIEDQQLDGVFATMALAQALGRGHTFQLLTKRPARAKAYLSGKLKDDLAEAAFQYYGEDAACALENSINGALGEGRNVGWPLRNVWLGVSVEDQERADERIPLLLQTPAAVRWVSYEPALGPVDFRPFVGPWRCGNHQAVTFNDCPSCIEAKTAPRINWIVVGGESGPGARPMDRAWLEAIVSECKAAMVPVFVKQMGKWLTGSHEGFSPSHWDMGNGRIFVPPVIGPYVGQRPEGAVAFSVDGQKGGNQSDWPEPLRVREFPEAR